MPTRHPPRFQLAITLAVSALAAAACVELVDHDTQHPAQGAAAVVPVAIAFGEPLAGPEPDDLELVGRSIASYDR